MALPSPSPGPLGAQPLPAISPIEPVSGSTIEPVTGSSRRYPRTPRQWWREDEAAPSVAIAALVVVGYLVVGLLPWGSRHAVVIAQAIYYWPTYLVGALVAWRASRHPALGPATRRAWALIAAAALCTFVSDSCWRYYEVVRGIEDTSVWIDFVSLANYPIWVFALLAFPVAPRAPRERIKYGFDVATVLVGGGLLAWYMVLRTAAAAAQTDHLTLFLALSYPVADLVLLNVGGDDSLRAPSEASRRALQLLAASVAIGFVADTVYGHMRLLNTYRLGDPVDILWLASGVLIVLAARVSVVDCVDGRGGTRPGRGLGASGDAPPLRVGCGGNRIAALCVAPRLGPGSGRGDSRIAHAHHPRGHAADHRSARQRPTGRRAHSSGRAVPVAGPERVGPGHGRQCRPSHLLPEPVHRPAVWALAVRGSRAWHSPTAHPDDAAGVQLFLHRTIAGGGMLVPVQWRMWHRDGTWRAVESIGMSLLHDSSVRGVVLNTRDVSERTALEAQLTHQAFHDPLTGLANRALLRDRAQHALTRTQRQGRRRWRCCSSISTTSRR